MSNEERKYRKRVNENGWMIKLQHLCWGWATPNFVGYCPFFWFTWFSLLLAPIVLPVRGLWLLFVISASRIALTIEERPFRPSNAALVKFYLHYLETLRTTPDSGETLKWEEEHNWGVFASILKWIRKTPDWENCAKRALALHQRREGKREEARATNENRKRRLVKLAQVASYVIKPLIAIACFVALFFLAKTLYFLFRHVTWSEVLHGLFWTGVAVAAAGAIVLLLQLIFRFARWFRRCPRRPERFAFLMRVFLKIGDGIAAVFGFLIETIETIYTRECPLIEWSDEDGEIESRW